MTGECVICHKFQPIQLDLVGDVVQVYRYVCHQCKPKDGVVILCTEDDQRLDISDDEARKVFRSGFPSTRVILLDQDTRDRVLIELLSEDDRKEMDRLKESILDTSGNIASLQGEIAEMEIDIDEWVAEIQKIITYRLEARR